MGMLRGALDGALLLLLLVGTALTMTAEAGIIERCNGAMLELVPCADSLRGKDAVPVSGDCCMGLSELLLSPECLCYAATTSQGFEMKQILGLPAACKYHVKSGQTCDGVLIPSYNEPPTDTSADPAYKLTPDILNPTGFSPQVLASIAAELETNAYDVPSVTSSP